MVVAGARTRGSCSVSLGGSRNNAWDGGSGNRDGVKRADGRHHRGASSGLVAVRWGKSPNASMCPTRATRQVVVSFWRRGTRKDV